MIIKNANREQNAIAHKPRFQIGNRGLFSILMTMVFANSLSSLCRTFEKHILQKIGDMNLTKRPISTKGKQKKAKLSTLVDKADKLASQYIRQKYADHAGNVTCISCDTVLHWKESHCAHYIDRSKKATRWLEENLHPACCSCNAFNKQFHMREYTLKMVDFYGRDFVNEIREIVKKTLSNAEVRKLAEEAIEYYGRLLKQE